MRAMCNDHSGRPPLNCFNTHTDAGRIIHSRAEARGGSGAAKRRLQHRDRERGMRRQMEGGTAEEEASGRIQAVRSAEANQLTGKNV